MKGYAVKNKFNGFIGLSGLTKAQAEREARRLNRIYNHWSQAQKMKFIVIDLRGKQA